MSVYRGSTRLAPQPIPLSPLSRLCGAWAIIRHPALRDSRLRLGPGAELLIGRDAEISVARGFVARRDLTLSVQGRLSIGHNLFCNRGVMIAAMNSVEIGDDVRFGERVSVIDHDHVLEPLSDVRARFDEYETQAITIGNRVLIGANTVVLPGAHIHDDAVVGAGSVVSGDVPAAAVAYGVPATLRRKLQ